MLHRVPVCLYACAFGGGRLMSVIILNYSSTLIIEKEMWLADVACLASQFSLRISDSTFETRIIGRLPYTHNIYRVSGYLLVLIFVKPVLNH